MVDREAKSVFLRSLNLARKVRLATVNEKPTTAQLNRSLRYFYTRIVFFPAKSQPPTLGVGNEPVSIVEGSFAM